MEVRQKPLEKMLDKDVNIYQIGVIEFNFFNGTKLNAKGRFYTKVLLVLLSLIYFITEKNAIMSGCLLSVLSFILPLLINLTGRVVLDKMKLKNDNLYDIAAAVGGYALVILPFVGIMVFAAVKLSEHFPALFSAITPITGSIIGVGLIGILVDWVLMRIEAKKKKLKI